MAKERRGEGEKGRVGEKKQETRNKKQETRYKKQETWNLEPGTIEINI